MSKIGDTVYWRTPDGTVLSGVLQKVTGQGKSRDRQGETVRRYRHRERPTGQDSTDEVAGRAVQVNDETRTELAVAIAEGIIRNAAAETAPKMRHRRADKRARQENTA